MLQGELAAVRRVWIRATVDGARVVERELQANERVTLRPARTIVVRAGDAGARPHRPRWTRSGFTWREWHRRHPHLHRSGTGNPLTQPLSLTTSNMAASQDPHAGQPVLYRGPAPADARLVAIMIHGRGASAEDILTLTQELRPKDVAYLAPQAAYTPGIPIRFSRPSTRTNRASRPAWESCRPHRTGGREGSRPIASC